MQIRGTEKYALTHNNKKRKEEGGGGGGREGGWVERYRWDPYLEKTAAAKWPPPIMITVQTFCSASWERRCTRWSVSLIGS